MSDHMGGSHWKGVLSVVGILLLVVVGARLLSQGSQPGDSTVPRLRSPGPGQSPEAMTIADLEAGTESRRLSGLDEPSGLRCEDASGEPVADARVSVDGSLLGSTTTDGQIRPDLLPGGSAGSTVIVEVSHPDLLPFRAYLQLPLQGQVILLERELGLTIHVWDSERRPIVGAHCRLGTPSAEELLAEGLSDTEGRVRLAGIEPQEAGLLVTATGFVGDWKLLEVTEDLHRLDVQLRAGRELLVRVSEPSGSPVEGARVECYLTRTTDRDPPFPRTVHVTGLDGVATVGSLPMERSQLEVTVRSDGFAARTVNMTLPAEELLDPVEVVLQRTTGIRITCAQPDRTPVAAEVAVVLLYKPARGRIALPPMTTVGLEGAELSGLPSGIPLGAAAFVDGAPAGLVEIEALAPGEIREVHIETLAFSTLRLRMIDRLGGPVEGAFVARPTVHREPPTYPSAWPMGDRVRFRKSRVECAIDGTGTLRLPSGEYEIQARGPGG